MRTLAYIKNVVMLVLLLFIAGFLYPIFLEKHSLEFIYNDSILYTTQGAFLLLVSLSSIILFVVLKFIHKLFQRAFFVMDLLYFINRFTTKDKDAQNILTRITMLKRHKQYKKALTLTQSNIQNSNEILFQHLLLLIKLNRSSEFIRTFKKYQCGKGIALFFSEIQKWSKWRSSLLIRRLYKKNLNNDVFAYIYCKHLFDIGQNEESYKVVKDFINNKMVFFRDRYTFYLFNKLALKLEVAESGGTDFAGQYIENINNYTNTNVR
jgi:hypothetical protein